MARFVFCVAIVLGLFEAATSPAIETVRVQATNGVPRIVVDGQPVRARMFWGMPGTKPLTAGGGEGPLSFEFTPTNDEPAHGTMHFRFGQKPGRIDLDEIRVEDLTAGGDLLPTCTFEASRPEDVRRWNVWPVGDLNTVGHVEVRPDCGRNGSGGMRITLRAPASGNWPDFHLHHQANLTLKKGHRYRVSLWVRAEPARDLTVAFYRPGNPYLFLGGPSNGYEEQIRLAGRAGAPFVSFPVELPWPPPGQEPDWSVCDAACETVLAANPNALLIPRIGVDAPEWWLKSHLDDAMVWDRGPQFPYACVASLDYRRAATERLAALVRHLEDKFGSQIAGYHPCGQNTGEWFYQETWGTGLNGYSAADRRAWQSWLKERYGDDRALRAAWQFPEVTIGSATVPSAEARRASPAGALRDPVAERSLIDFAQFQQESMAECVCQLAATVRQATRGRKLVLFFYGYVFEFGAIQNGASTAGHYALRRVLQCPDIDVLCAPISYWDRGLGQSAPAMTAAESVALAGKLWLSEDDTRTYLGTGQFPGWADGVDSLEDTNRLLLRNTGQCAVRNFGTWWMDLGATGWFNDPRMWAEMARLAALDQALLDQPRPYQPDVAAVLDEASLLRATAVGTTVTRAGVYQVRRPLGRMGAPYGQYLQDDVLDGKVPAKLLVFLTAWRMTAAERQKLRAATQGKTCLWCYAPAFHEEQRTSLEAMRELTGFSFRSVSPPQARAIPTLTGNRLGIHETWGVDGPLNPLFAVTDATDEETLARYPDGSTAVALRHGPHGRSLFVGAPGLTAELLRCAAREAGVHLFTHTDCNVYATEPYLVLHASQDGPVTVDAGRTGPIRNLLDGQEISAGPRVTLTLKKGDTRLLFAAPAHSLERRK